jgi:hypothetical protein
MRTDRFIGYVPLLKSFIQSKPLDFLRVGYFNYTQNNISLLNKKAL